MGGACITAGLLIDELPGWRIPPCFPHTTLSDSDPLDVSRQAALRSYLELLSTTPPCLESAAAAPGAAGWELPVTLAAQSQLALWHLAPGTWPAMVLQAHCTLHPCFLSATGGEIQKISATVFTHPKHTL